MEVDIKVDEIRNLAILYGLSNDVDFDKHPVKRVDMTKSDALALNHDFFKSLKPKNNVRFLKTIEGYSKKIDESRDVEGGIYGMEHKLKKVVVPKLDNVYAASILTHEYTHALEFERKVNIRREDFHQEITPFLNQFLFLEFLKKYYYVDEVIQSNLDFMIHNQLLYNAHEYGNAIEDGKVNIPKAVEHLKYIYGSMYSIALYEWYKADEEFMKLYSKVYTKDKTIEDLLKHYEVTFGDIDNMVLVKSLMK